MSWLCARTRMRRVGTRADASAVVFSPTTSVEKSLEARTSEAPRVVSTILRDTPPKVAEIRCTERPLASEPRTSVSAIERQAKTFSGCFTINFGIVTF